METIIMPKIDIALKVHINTLNLLINRIMHYAETDNPEQEYSEIISNLELVNTQILNEIDTNFGTLCFPSISECEQLIRDVNLKSKGLYISQNPIGGKKNETINELCKQVSLISKEFDSKLSYRIAELMKYKLNNYELRGIIKSTQPILHVDDQINKTKKQKNVVVDKDELSLCFNSRFKGSGRSDNYFEIFITDLKTIHNNKDIARVALLIHKSKYLVLLWKSRPFKGWYAHFCEIVNFDYIESYTPNKLKDEKYNTMQRSFYYLQNEM